MNRSPTQKAFPEFWIPLFLRAVARGMIELIPSFLAISRRRNTEASGRYVKLKQTSPVARRAGTSQQKSTAMP